MASFRLLVCCLILSGCASAIAVTPADVIVVPAPKIYACTDEKALAAAWDSLPPIARQYLNDYHSERVTLGKLRGSSVLPCAN